MIMDYYAFLNSNNVVTEVIPGKDQGSDNTDWEQWYGEFRGQVCKLSRTDGFRKNHAGVGYTYDETRDAFIPTQPFPSWTLDEANCLWESPTLYPTDGQRYEWDEQTTSWVLINV
jgi:hypothetical protein